MFRKMAPYLIVVDKVVHQLFVVSDEGLGQLLLGVVVLHDPLDEEIVPGLAQRLPELGVVQHHRVGKVHHLAALLMLDVIAGVGLWWCQDSRIE